MKKLITIIAMFICLSGSDSEARFKSLSPGELRGKVIDKETGQPLAFANVAIVKDESAFTGGTTDEEGNYRIKPLDPGSYTVKATYVGYSSVTINEVIISQDKITYLNISLSANNTLPPVVIRYIPPLINDGKISTMTCLPSSILKDMPAQTIQDMVATVPGVIQKDEGGALYFRGARENATQYIVDGIKMYGSFSVPRSAIAQISVITGGMPAQFGDATGGIVVITTKSYVSE
ncbi:MAG: carboxypeptidase regulatory-like domain-containing protein [Bacteroidia bacterium]